MAAADVDMTPADAAGPSAPSGSSKQRFEGALQLRSERRSRAVAAAVRCGGGASGTRARGRGSAEATTLAGGASAARAQ